MRFAGISAVTLGPSPSPARAGERGVCDSDCLAWFRGRQPGATATTGRARQTLQASWEERKRKS